MSSYQLTLYQSVIRLTDRAAIPFDPGNADYQEYLRWLAAGNTPLPADTLTPEQQTRVDEINAAPGVARTWYASHQAAIDFIRLAPAQQEAQIDLMTTAQLKTLLKYLTIAVTVIVKRELL